MSHESNPRQTRLRIGSVFGPAYHGCVPVVVLVTANSRARNQGLSVQLMSVGLVKELCVILISAGRIT